MAESEARQRWRRSVYKVLERRYKRLLFRTPASSSLRFRLSRAYFHQERFTEALDILDELCASSGHSKHWYLQSRCNSYLHHQTGDSVYLEKAFNGLKMAIQTTPLSMAIVCQLPPLLHELAQLYEAYGALEAAMSVYGQIAAQFPNYSRMLQVLHRCSIVMLALAELPGSPKEKLVSRAMRITQKLTEAKAAVGQDSTQLAVAFTYVRACEQSTSEKATSKRDAALEELFTLAQATGLAEATHQDWQAWEQDSESWLRLGRHLRAAGEKRLAAASMEAYVERVQAHQPEGIDTMIEIPVCLEIAQNYAELQDFQAAIEMAAKALSQDHFNPQVRALLSQWSENYAAMFSREKNMVTLLTSAWRGRIFSKRYLDKYKHLVLADLEAQIIANPLDMAVRKQLAYFARDKWRAQFLYEEKCATTIQRAFRSTRGLKKWKSQQRNKMLNLAAALYAEYKLQRYEYKIRQRVRHLVANRYCPKRHIIKSLPAQFAKEEAAAVVIQRVVRCHQAAVQLASRRQAKLDAELAVRKEAAATIIRLFEKRLRRRTNARRRVQRRTERRAATLLQRHYRSIRLLPGHRQWAAEMEEMRQTRRVRRNLFKWLAITVAKFLHIRRRFRRKLAVVFKMQVAARRWLGRCRRKRLLAQYAAKIQRRWLRARDALSIRECVELLRTRRRTLEAAGGCASTTSELLQRIRGEQAEPYYKPPGMLTNSAEFLSFAKRVAIICSGCDDNKHKFELSDGVMLGAAARSGILNLRVVVFENVALLDTSKCKAFLRGFAAVLTQCMYLKSVVFVRCHFTAGTLKQLVDVLPVHGRRLLDLRFEGCTNQTDGLDPSVLLRTFTDYFFHTNAALRTLSLSGMELDDAAAENVAKALDTWRNLESLILANNGITDQGACPLLQTLAKEPLRLQLLDLSGNLISSHPSRDFLRAVHCGVNNTKPTAAIAAAHTSADRLICAVFDLIENFLHGATHAPRPRSPSDASPPHVALDLSRNPLAGGFHRLVARQLRAECGAHVQHLFHAAAGRHSRTCPAAIALDGRSRRECMRINLQQSCGLEAVLNFEPETLEALQLCNVVVLI